MFKQRLTYRLFLIFLIFALIFMIPLFLTINKELNHMAKEEAAINPLAPEVQEIHNRLFENVADNIVVFSFYFFIFAFILSLFFSKSLLKPIKALYRASLSIKDGNLGVRLDVAADDELGQVTKSFNEMAASLEKKTEELKKKDTYVSAMMDPLLAIDGDNAISDINPAFTKLFGYDRDEAIGGSIYDFLDDKNLEIMRSLLEQDKNDTSMTSEIQFIAKGGSPMPVLITLSPITANTNSSRKIAVLKDFRRERELIDTIKESRDYLDAVINSINDELMVIDREYRVISANRAVLERCGEKAVGEYCYSVSHKQSVPCWLEGEECPVKKVFETGETVRMTHRHKIEGDKEYFYEIVASPIKDESGSVVHVIELMRDITARKRYEEKIAQKNRELVTINNIAAMLSRSLKAEDIFGNVLDRLISLVTMDGGGIFLIDDAKKEMTCPYHKGVSEEFVRNMGRVKLGEDIPGRVAVTGKLIAIPDIDADRHITKSILKHSGIKGYCAIPIKGKEKIAGVICLLSFKPHIFTSEEERLLTSIGEITGMAIENIRLYEKMRRLYEYQRQRRTDDHKNLLSLSSGLTAANNIKEAADSAVELIKKSFRADLVWLLRRENNELTLRSCLGADIKEGEIIYLKDTTSIEQYAIDKRNPVIIHAIPAETRFYLSDYISSYKSAVSIPLYAGEKALGVFTLYYATLKDLTEDDIHFLQMAASTLAVALGRQELHENRS